MKKIRIQVFQHEEFEGPGSIADWAHSRGHEIKVRHLYLQNADGLAVDKEARDQNRLAQNPLPKTDDYDWLIVMGGSMGVHDEAKLPWLKSEKAHLKLALDADKPILGICLGAQLLADVLGASVTKNRSVEIGWFPVTVAEKAKQTWLGEILPNVFTPFHWHGDTFAIPEEAVALGHSDACANQGFLWKGKVLGLQFHPEVTPFSLESLIKNCGNELVPGKFVQDEKALQAGLPNAIAVNKLMDQICERFECIAFKK